MAHKVVKPPQTAVFLPELLNLSKVPRTVVFFELRQLLLTVAPEKKCLAAKINYMTKAAEAAVATLLCCHPWTKLYEYILNSSVVILRVVQHKVTNLSTADLVFLYELQDSLSLILTA